MPHVLFKNISNDTKYENYILINFLNDLLKDMFLKITTIS